MINSTLLFKELRENRVKFMFMFAILGILGIIIPLLFEWVNDILQNMEFLPFINPGELSFILSNYGNYAWSQWTAKNLTQMATFAAILLGMGALSGEVAYGTAPFLLSKPLSRRRIYTTKIVAGITMLAVIVFGPTLILMAVSAMKDVAFDKGVFLISTVITFAGALVIYFGTTVFSVLISEPVRAGVAAALFWLLASIPGYFKSTAAYSIFFQMKAIRYWLFGESPFVPLLFFLVISLIFFETGVFLWSRKDI